MSVAVDMYILCSVRMLPSDPSEGVGNIIYLGLEALGVPEEKVQRCRRSKTGNSSPSPSCRSRGEAPRETARPWPRRGREAGEPGASAARARERGTASERRGWGG